MRVLVLGCGRVGSSVARELVARGAEVVVVDHLVEALARLGDGFPGRKVHGSALDHDTLTAADITHADAVAVVTGSDVTNAVVALAARRTFRVPTVIARVADPRTAVLHQRLGIRALSPVTWGVQRIADLATATSVTSVASLGRGTVEMVDAEVPSVLGGRPVGELEVTGEIHVVALTRDGRTVLTSPASVMATGDTVHVAVGTAAVGRLEALLGRGR